MPSYIMHAPLHKDTIELCCVHMHCMVCKSPLLSVSVQFYFSMCFVHTHTFHHVPCSRMCRLVRLRVGRAPALGGAPARGLLRSLAPRRVAFHAALRHRVCTAPAHRGCRLGLLRRDSLHLLLAAAVVVCRACCLGAGVGTLSPSHALVPLRLRRLPRLLRLRYASCIAWPLCSV